MVNKSDEIAKFIINNPTTVDKVHPYVLGYFASISKNMEDIKKYFSTIKTILYE